MSTETIKNESETTQFRIQLDTATVRVLDSLAKRFGKRSAAATAAEILRTYWPLMEQSEQAKADTIRQQVGQIEVM